MLSLVLIHCWVCPMVGRPLLLWVQSGVWARLWTWGCCSGKQLWLWCQVEGMLYVALPVHPPWAALLFIGPNTCTLTCLPNWLPQAISDLDNHTPKPGVSGASGFLWLLLLLLPTLLVIRNRSSSLLWSVPSYIHSLTCSFIHLFIPSFGSMYIKDSMLLIFRNMNVNLQERGVI